MGPYVEQIWGWDDKRQREILAAEWPQERDLQIILYDRQPIGSILLKNEDHHLHIGRFYLLPEYQNKGIGTYILQDVLEKADKARKATTLGVLKINPAIELYKRHGFIVTGTNEFQYLMERKPGGKTMKYKAVIFDLFGTLVDIFSRQEYENIVAEMASILKTPYDDFYKTWMQSAKMRTTGVFRTIEENLEYICRELKVKVIASQIEAARSSRHNYVTRALTPRKDAIEVISSLKSAGFKIGLISNCSTEPPLIWPNTPFAPFFDTVLFSSVVGINKPDLRIFQRAVERLMVEPSKCVYIGDGGDNELAAAADIGMTPVLIRASHEDSADALRPNDEIKDFAGPVISSLKEVLNLVK
jgi:putative hydrolase of the HAD superfamily